METTTAAKTIFEGRVLTLEVLDVKLASGRRSQREIVRHRGAVVVLPELPDGRFAFVRQFRKPVEKEVLEAVAGTLDEGEDPDAAAARELKEETGYEAERLEKLGVIFSAPGYSDERLHVYWGRVRGERSEGTPDEDEEIETQALSASDMDGMIRRGEIEDAKTLAAWLLYTKRSGGRR